MSGVQDRPYQRHFVHGDENQPGVYPAWEAGDHSVLGILPTGCGKTVCAGMIAEKAFREEGRRTLFLAHREELIHQAVDKIGRFNLECGVEMGDQKIDNYSLFNGGEPDVCVATVQTLQGARLARRGKSEFGVIITDEAHHARAASYRRIFDHFRDYYHLGITATPDRADGRNLGAVYSRVAYEYSLRSAIRDGWLVPILTVRLPCGVDLRDIKTTGGDYNQGELEDRIGPHIEALCDITKREIGDRQTVIFTPDVGSAHAAASALGLMGVNARAVSGKTPKSERRKTLEDFADGQFQVVICCDLLIEGWDCPRASCIVVMRPTKSRSRYCQMIGRGTRLYESLEAKPNCLVVDFAWETTSNHELVTSIDLFDDSETDDAVTEIAEKLMAEGKERDPMRAIDEAERIHREEVSLKIKLTGARTTYKKIVFDPVGVGSVLGLPIKAGWDFNPNNPATAKQLETLRNMRVENPEGISKTGAGKIIDFMIKRRIAGLATPKQVGYLVNLGVEISKARTMKFEEASAAIDQMSRQKRAG